ncbi:MAG: STAS domain-containing protein [Bacteroidia bacterium]
MENIVEINSGMSIAFEDSIFESHKVNSKPEEKNPRNIRRVELFGNRLSIKDEPMTRAEFNELAGAYFTGTQYYDLKNVHFINNTGIANLIDLLKSMLEQGVEVKFVNVNQCVKDKIKSMGLEKILNCC